MQALENQTFHEYFSEWIETYKQGSVRPVTYQKYLMTLRNLTELEPGLKICDLNKRNYQNLINSYAQTHEKQTTKDFHNHLKSVILDAIDEGLLTSDPTRKAVMKGKTPADKKPKYLSQFELDKLIGNLELTRGVNWDWLILLATMTGMRLSEMLGITPKDLDISQRTITVNKTWDYKRGTGFDLTKNKSSIRKIQIDKTFAVKFRRLIKKMNQDKPIFVQNGEKVFNSTINSRLKTLCKKAEIPIIAIHSLRHTHASLLIYAGVSVVSVSRRLGHANTTTTQNTYLHIIKELEDKDNAKIMKIISNFDKLNQSAT